MMKRRIVALLAILLLCCASAWALTQGPNNSGKGVSVNNGLPGWTSPNNIASSGQNSSASVPTSGISGELQASNFGFAIPVGSVINGIQVSINRKANVAGQVSDIGIFLLKNGVDVGLDHSNAANWPNAFAAQTYGTVADLWGTTWGPLDVNSPNFGVGITVQNNDAVTRLATVQGFVTITITFTGPPAGLSYSPGIIGTFF